MNIRDLINELEDIAKRSGDRADVTISVWIEDEDGGGFERTEDVLDVRYLGGSAVGLRT